MNRYIAILSVALMAVAAPRLQGANDSDSTSSTLADGVRLYNQAIDRVIIQFIDSGEPPSAAAVMAIQEWENRLLSMKVLRPNVKLPPLLLSTQIQLRDTINIPGQLIIARAKNAGLDLWQDRLPGKTFTVVP